MPLSSFRKQKIPTVSEKVANEDIISNKKKKKKSSTGSSGSKKDSNANLPTSERKNSKEKKSKRSKKKSSREEEDETKSEINLLSASADPSHKIIEDNSAEENEGSELQAPAPAPSIVVEKPKKTTSKKKKSSRKSSVGSVKDQLADSHSSLRDYFPDTALKNYLQGLHVSLFFTI